MSPRNIEISLNNKKKLKNYNIENNWKDSLAKLVINKNDRYKTKMRLKLTSERIINIVTTTDNKRSQINNKNTVVINIIYFYKSTVWPSLEEYFTLFVPLSRRSIHKTIENVSSINLNNKCMRKSTNILQYLIFS